MKPAQRGRDAEQARAADSGVQAEHGAPSAPRSAGEMLARARAWLAPRAPEEPRLEAELLVAHALGKTRLELFLALDQPVSEAEIARARELLVRRARREPVAYIVGTREFYGRPFRVTADVLIPRPETELVVDLVRKRAGAVRRSILSAREAPPERGARVAELGTGSGCLAITLALELRGSSVVASDVSAAALEVARANAAALGAEVVFVEGDGLAPLAAAGAGFDLLVSNPPYVDRAAAASLAPEVRDHEPALALFAPAGDPDHWVRRLLDEGLPLLAPGGSLWVELGADQAPRALALAAARGLEARVHADLAGVPRVLAVESRL